MNSPTKANAIDNKPYMQVIKHRIGRYAAFRSAMLDAVNRELPRWSVHEGEDYGVALMEMWAYLADILAFYQERIANEAFIRTAVLRESIIFLSEFIDYRLDPGVAAKTFIALIADKGKSGIIPGGFRVQGKIAGEPVKVFQTDETITISSEQNMLKLVSEKPFPQLKKDDIQLILEGTNLNLKIGDWILILDEERNNYPLSEKWELRLLTNVEEKGKRTTVTWSKGDYQQYPKNPRVYVFREAAFPFGSNAPDYTMMPPEKRPWYLFNWDNVPGIESEKLKEFLKILGVSWLGELQFIKDNKNISISDIDHSLFIGLNEKNTKATLYIENKSIYEFIVQAENNRLYVNTTLMDASTTKLGDLAGKGTKIFTIYFDSINKKITAGSYIAAVKSKNMELYKVTKTYDITKVGFGLSSKVTAATVDTNSSMNRFKLRETVLLCVNQELTPATMEVDPSLVEIDPSSTVAQELKVKGKLSAGAYIAISGEGIKGERYSEVRRIEDAVQKEDVTTITLDRPLLNSYRKDSAVIYGNVVPATFGEPVKNEILGSGDASMSFQRFNLKKTPVTYLPDPAFPHGAKNSLELFVNDVLWEEKESFMDSGPKDMHYITGINEKDEMSITFGDGSRGAKLQTGKDNIIARYRKGVGGNADENIIKGMVDSSVTLKSVVNPVPASGGAMRESGEKAKEIAPMLLRAFDRAVSFEDYPYVARSFSGVAKARAFWEGEGEGRAILLRIALQNGRELDDDLKKRLRSFLDMRRDTNQRLIIKSYAPVHIKIIIKVMVKTTHFNAKVKSDVERALGRERNEDGSYNFFAFERLDFGMSIHISDIYSCVEGINGVESLTVNTFAIMLDSKTIKEQNTIIPINDMQIAQLKELLVNVEGGVE